MARIYVAGSCKMAREVNCAQAILEEAGHQITFDWTADLNGIKTDWSDHLPDARWRSLRERVAVKSADVVVLVAPPVGRGLGCFIEVGMALAARTPVVVWGDARESVFWYLPEVTRVTDRPLAALPAIVTELTESREF